MGRGGYRDGNEGIEESERGRSNVGESERGRNNVGEESESGRKVTGRQSAMMCRLIQ